MTLLRMSLLKLVRRPATWVVFLILIALIMVLYLSLAATAGQMESFGDEFQVRTLLGFPTAYTVVVGIMLDLGGLLAIIFGAAVIGADWAWGTIRAIVARGESRVRYTLITFLAITIVLGVGVVATFAIGALTAVIGAEIAGIGSEGASDPETLATLPDLLARTWLGVTTQAAIGFAIAMIFKSQLAGIGAGLALYFAGIILFFVPLLRDVLIYLPLGAAGAVVGTTEDLGTGGFGTVPTLDPDTAVLWSIAYLVIALAIASVAAWRAQITQ